MPPDLVKLDDLSTLVAAEDGRPLSVLTAGDGRLRLAVAPEQVDAGYLAMLLAAEDKRFYRHPGVDPLAMVRAVGQWLATGRVASGGSTITMQVARLLEPRPRTVAAKLRQIARAVQLEIRYSKRDILGMYLMLAPFGGNVEGVRMAALAYFQREPAELTAGQAALLAALPRSPERLRPDRHPDAAKAGRDTLVARLGRQNSIPAEMSAAATAEEIPVRRQAYGLAPHLARHLAARGGARDVWTTLNRPLQARLEAVAREEARWMGDGAVAILVADIATRRVLAWVGNSGLERPQGHVDMVLRRRSPGSALKPFIYAMGFDQHLIHPETVVEDRPTRFGGYMPRNFDREYQGQVTIREALIASLNTPAVAVLDRVGPDRFRTAMVDAGIALHLPDEAGPPGLALALGGVGVTLHDLVAGYAALASDGKVRSLTALGGQASGAPRPLVGAQAAAAITAILAGAPRPPQVAASGTDHRGISFKTGTSYGFRDAWAMGWTGRHVVGVWVGRVDGSPRPGAMGRTAAAPILFRAFDTLGGSAQYSVSDGPQVPASARAKAPVALAHLDGEGRVGGKPHILYPVGDGIIDIPTTKSGPIPSVPLTASGGRPPYRWYVDGIPLPASPEGNGMRWQPMGEGFVRVTVVDAQGRSDSRQTQIRFGSVR